MSRCKLLLLVLAWVRAICGTQFDHADATTKSLERAEALRNTCIAQDKAHIQAGKDPLTWACDSRPVFVQYLFAVRHLFAFLRPEFSDPSSSSLLSYFLPRGQLQEGADTDAFLTYAGELDHQLSQLVLGGKIEPYYFWHGPKRHIPGKVQKLLDWEMQGVSVRSLLSARHSTQDPAALTQRPSPPPPPRRLPALGLIYPSTARTVDVLENAAIRIVGEGDACVVSASAVEVGIRHFIAGGPGSKRHLKSCLHSSLKVTWDLGDAFMDLFSERSQSPLQDGIDDALALLKRSSLNAVALPYKAWSNKRLKGYVQSAMKGLITTGKVKSVALAGAVSSNQLQKLLTGGLRPAFWLAPHDDSSQISPSCLEVADKAKPPLKVIAVGLARGVLLDTVAMQSSLTGSQFLGRWTVELGMGIAFPHTTANLGEEIKRIQEAAPISEDAWRLLSGSAALSRTATLAVSDDFEDTFGIKGIIGRAAKLAVGDLRSDEPPDASNTTLGAKVWNSVSSDRTVFEENNFIIYKNDFLSPEVYSLVKEEAARLWQSPELEPNCNLDGKDRAGGYVLDTSMHSSSLYQHFYGNDEFRRWVSRINGHQMFPSDFPVELREYPQGSTGMGCHRDLLMYTNATLDLEFVYTIDNLGTCISTYEDKKDVVHEVHTQANSLIMVRPNAAMHCVKPSEGGRRTILKFIYVGDYRKSSEFGYYTENECGGDNPNVRILLARRGHGEL